MINFNYLGLDLIFHPNLTDDRRFHFYINFNRKIGFFDRSLYEVWGKPNKDNYLEVLDSYIKASPEREAILKSNAEFINTKINE